MSWESQLCCSTRNHTAMIHNSIRQGILHPYCHSHLAAPMTRNFWFGTQPKFQRCFWFHLCQSTMPMSYRCVSVSSVSDQICACCAVGRGRGKPDLVSRITSMATFREAWPIGNWVCFQNLWVHRLCVHAHEDAEKQQAHFCILTLKCDIRGHFFLVLWTLEHIDFCSNYRFSSQKGLSERINQMVGETYTLFGVLAWVCSDFATTTDKFNMFLLCSLNVNQNST